MPYPLENLIEGRGKPITVHPSASVPEALELMIEHDFSQLPVVDQANHPLGTVTNESILRALNNFGVRLEDLSVSNALEKAQTFSPEDDLFDLLDRLKQTNAVLIVDREGMLRDIVTSYDSTEYFRRRAEDMMLVEDIESMVKDLIASAVTDESGEVDEERLWDAIERVTRSRDDFPRFKQALAHYLRLEGDEKPQIEPDHAKESFSCLVPEKEPKAFDELTLYDYTELLLHHEWWQIFEPFFNMRADAVRRLLDGVRDIRNDLAHFRGELRATQRDQLKFCADWLGLHPVEQLMELQVGIPVDWPFPHGKSEPAALRESRDEYGGPSEEELTVVPTEEELSPSDSRYAPLAIWLQSRPSRDDRVRVTFEEVEEIIGGPLPPSAHMHRSWWANDSVGHVQSKQWLEVGWRVAQVSMSERRATFARIREREKAYIEFFSALQTDLRQEAMFPVKEMSPGGWSYLPVASMPEGGPQCLHFIFAFAHRSRFRVEFYIDTSNRDKSKGIFDHLHIHREEIEGALGAGLAWERLDDKKASRIAWYHAGSITDDEESLSALRAWAVDAMVRFHKALAQPASGALDGLRQGQA